MGAEEALWLCEIFSAYWTESEYRESQLNRHPKCRNYIFHIRAVFFLVMLMFNGIMWTTFVKALRFSRTSLEATITNTAANFFFTAIFGQILFGEFLTLMWWIGTLLIIFGLLLMHKGNQQETTSTLKRRKRL